jgi:hypothetical protein
LKNNFLELVQNFTKYLETQNDHTVSLYSFPKIGDINNTSNDDLRRLITLDLVIASALRIVKV